MFEHCVENGRNSSNSSNSRIVASERDWLVSISVMYLLFDVVPESLSMSHGDHSFVVAAAAAANCHDRNDQNE